MIITQLKGGLGNQMFQFAAGLALAAEFNSEFKIDLSFYNDQPKTVTPREYELGYFVLDYKFADNDDLEKFNYYTKFPFKYSPKLQYIYNLFAKRYIYKEKNANRFQNDFFNLIGDFYLQGYWQSEKYFGKHHQLVRDSFDYKEKAKGNNKKFLDQILNTESVSLHIRRGDYVTDKATNAFHGLCDLNYYHHCVKEITKKIKKPHFFIFSDDPKWVKENLKLKYPAVYVTGNDGKGHEDLRLMRNCKHNIIANSSFSWWGAWLNENPDKIVYSPSKWFAGVEGDTTKDRIPKSWIKV